MWIWSKFLINHTAHETEKISDDEALLNPPKLLQTVTMTTSHNEKYVCELPAEDSTKEQEDEEYTVSKAIFFYLRNQIFNFSFWAEFAYPAICLEWKS